MAIDLKLGLDTYSYHFAAPFWDVKPPRPWSIHDYMRRAAELKLDGLALADMQHLKRTDDDAIDALKREADDLGIYLELGTGGCDVEHLTTVLQMSARLGATALRSFTSIGRTWTPGSAPGSTPGDYEEGFERCAQSLRQVAPVCEKTGVAIALENHQDMTSRELLDLIQAVDHPLIGVCLDTGNSLGVMEDPLEAAKRLAPYTLTTHFKSYAVIPHETDGNLDGYTLLGVPIGENRKLLSEILALLRTHSPAQTLHINIESAVEYIPLSPQRPGWSDDKTQQAVSLLEKLGLRVADIADIQHRIAPWMPRREMSVEELLALEDRLVRQSVADAKELVS